MIKKLYIIAILFLTIINVSLLDTKAIETFSPFSYVSNGTSGDVKYHTLYSHYFPIPAEPTYLSLYIPKTSYYKSSITASLHSAIYLYNDVNLAGDHVWLDSVDWEVLWVTNFNGQMFLDDVALAFYNFDDYDYFSITLYQDYASMPNVDYLRWFNERFEFTWDDEIAGNWGTKDLTYIVNDAPYYEVMFTTIPDAPVDPIADNLLFNGWRDIDGNIYDFTTTLLSDVDQPVGATTLMATWVLNIPSDVVVPTDSTPSALTTFLTTLGFNNTIGKLIIYFALMLVVTFFLITIEFNGFIIILINVLLYAVFIFLGWLPIYMIIILGLIFATGLVKSFKGGT